MNYRHAFHAGNFADVVKHAILTLLISRLKEKDAAFRVIDTHAGPGLYDLSSDPASRTGEWKAGIGRVFAYRFAPADAALLAPYLDTVSAANAGAELGFYPGSPWIARHLLRRQDRLTAVELHPDDAASLSGLFAGDRQVKTIALDGRLALGAFVPPKERRGLVLIDPPFEEDDEFEQMLSGLVKAHARWPSGIFALWYPVKDLYAIDRFRAGLVSSGIRRLLRAELLVRGRSTPLRFNGAGLVICNPPWQFKATMTKVLSALTPVLADGPEAASEIEVITDE